MVGLVVEGGASRTYFSVGVMDVLMENDITVNYINGASAGISNAMNFASHQIGRALEIGMNYVPSKKYYGMRNMLNPKNRSVFNIDHVFREIPNELVPYDYDAFRRFGGVAEAAVTNIETGKPEYLRVSPDDTSWRALVATCSLPIMFPPVEIDGKLYMDGGITDSVPFMHAKDVGCDKLIVILSRERSYLKSAGGETKAAAMAFKKYPEFVKALSNRYVMYNSQRKKLFELEAEGGAFVIMPDDTVGWKRTENHAEKLKFMYDKGVEKATAQLGALKEYLAK